MGNLKASFTPEEEKELDKHLQAGHLAKDFYKDRGWGF